MALRTIDRPQLRPLNHELSLFLRLPLSRSDWSTFRHDDSEENADGSYARAYAHIRSRLQTASVLRDHWSSLRMATQSVWLHR
jgi:hypothetical protein